MKMAREASRKKRRLRRRDDLPTEIIEDILLLLPVKPLLRFRCVSRSWCKLLDSDYFIHKHLNHHRKQTKPNTLVATRDKFYSFDGKPQEEAAAAAFNSDVMEDYGLVWGSCNGLVCLSHPRGGFDVQLWNPSTRRNKVLKHSPMLEGVLFVVHGFGYNTVTQDYEVVSVGCFYGAAYRIGPSQVRIHSLRNNNWKLLQNIYYQFRKEQKGTLVNGSLHWVATRAGRPGQPIVNVNYNTIVAYHIASQTFSEVPQPDTSAVVTIHVAELDAGKLGAVYDYKTRFELWVMKDYGAVESWTKLFNIIDHDHVDPANDIRLCGSVPLCFINNNRQALMVRDFRKLFLYDLRNQTARPVEEFRFQIYRAITFIETLVALD